MTVRLGGPDECWPWEGGKNKQGYGQFRAGPTVVQPHRVMYRLHVGPIPKGYEIDHLCKNRACCNPKHLEAVTTKENNARSPKQDFRKRDLSQSPVAVARMAAGLSRQALADKAVCSYFTIINAEVGRHTPQRGTQLRIARALGMDVADLFTDTPVSAPAVNE